MNDDASRFLDTLRGVPDVGAHTRELERRVAESDHAFLEALIAGIEPTAADEAPDSWQFRSIRDHLRRLLAMGTGPRDFSILLEQLHRAGTPAGPLRDAAACLADAQAPRAIVAALERSETRPEALEFARVLVHEAALRRKIDDSIPIVRRIVARLLEDRHPLAWLPLRLIDVEAEAPAFLTRYYTRSTEHVTPGAPSESRDGEVADPATIEPFPTYREVTNPARVEMATASIKTWLDLSNGMFEARFFEFDEPISARRVRPSMLRALGLASLGGKDDRGAVLKESTAAEAFSHLFSAAANGGAYVRGEGGAYGRLVAWRSLSALIGGRPDAAAAALAALAKECSWYTFQSGWFYDAAWDLGLVALDGEGKSLAVFAASDTD